MNVNAPPSFLEFHPLGSRVVIDALLPFWGELQSSRVYPRLESLEPRRRNTSCDLFFFIEL